MKREFSEVLIVSSDPKVWNAVSAICSPKLATTRTVTPSQFQIKRVQKSTGVVVLHVEDGDEQMGKILHQIKDLDDAIRIIAICKYPTVDLERKIRSKGVSFWAVWPEDRSYLRDVLQAMLLKKIREEHNRMGSIVRENQRVFG